MAQNWKSNWWTIKAILKTILSLWWLFTILAIIIITIIAIIFGITSGQIVEWYSQSITDFTKGEFLLFFVLLIVFGKPSITIKNNIKKDESN